MNDKQQRILRYYQTRPNNPPSVREVMAACGISSGSVAAYNINALVEAGRLERFGGHGQARGVRLAGPDKKSLVSLLIENSRLRQRVAALEQQLAEAGR